MVQLAPSPSFLTPRGLLTLPFRLCNPPPAVGKVRSCSVTPMFQVKLEDVLDRKHLPPLGLKDFEEWLLFVEKSPENLYFILWLREYTLKYAEWVKDPNKPTFSPFLASFVSRAKATFLVPHAPYTLDVSESALAPFHAERCPDPSLTYTLHDLHPTCVPHPHPAVFSVLEAQTKTRLRESLTHFVSASYNNVGTQRALCGITAGTFMTLFGGFPPLLYTLLHGTSRWLRLTAALPLWIGFTILIASLHGMCIVIYIFGDLRQLRKFELNRLQGCTNAAETREKGSTLTPLRIPVRSVPISAPMPRTSYVPPSTCPSSDFLRPSPIASPELAFTHDSWAARSQESVLTTFSSCSCESRTSCSCSIPHHSAASHSACGSIWVSPAYVDGSSEEEDPQERREQVETAGFITYEEAKMKDATTRDSISRRTELDLESGRGEESSATSIHSTRSQPSTSVDTRTRSSPSAFSFNFDLLPSPQTRASATSSFISASARGLLSAAQERCVDSPTTGSGDIETRWEAHLADVRHVPAFGPLTRVVSPVVTRAHWEIVVRSALAGAVCTTFLLGALLAVPERRVL